MPQIGYLVVSMVLDDQEDIEQHRRYVADRLGDDYTVVVGDDTEEGQR